MPSWLIIILQLVQALPGLIRTAEDAFSGVPGKSGKAKKDLVMQSARTVLDTGERLGYAPMAANKDTILDAVSSLTDTTVTLMNTVHALQKNPGAE